MAKNSSDEAARLPSAKPIRFRHFKGPEVPTSRTRRSQETAVLPRVRTSRQPEWMSLPANENQLQEWFLSGKRHPAMKMADNAIRMNRSPNQGFILLVGLSGTGKSSTVNYLFETDIAETSDVESMTHSSIEYTVKMASNEWKIPDLKLSIIDTPGFCDTEGLFEDAKNIMTIKYFLENHPCMRKCYPNLVMIVVSIHDNRIEGKSSSFVKMLKGISILKVIDHSRPNVVVILTHASSVARNPEVWKDKVERKKTQVHAIVRFHLGLDPEVVVQENRPDENDLERDGDWYILPNGEKQPKILFQACENILNRAKDQIGHEGVVVCFRPGKNKNVSEGQNIPSSSIKNQDAMDMHAILLQSVVQVSTSEVFNMLEKHKNNTSVRHLDNEILILQVRFRDLGITNTSDLQDMSMNELMAKISPIRLRTEMKKVVECVFGLSYEQSTIDCHVGKGYNIFKDSPTIFSPLVMQEDEKVRYGLPTNVNLKECSSFELKCKTIKDRKDYVCERLRELKVDFNGDINFTAFCFELRSGYNKHNASKYVTKHSSKEISFSAEHRVQKLEVRQPFKITEEFKSAVQSLPSDYDNENHVMRWKAFFEKWGMYVVIGEYMGGSLTGQVKVSNDDLGTSTFEDAHAALAMKMSFLQRDATIDFSKDRKYSTLNKTISSLQSACLTWNGGKKETYKSPLESIELDDWRAWVGSLEDSPAPLLHSLDLYPLYQLASEVSEEKCTLMQKVMNLALKGQLTHEKPKEDNRMNTAVSNESGNCFHKDSFVMLPNRKLKRMKDLSVGDKILILKSNGTLAQDEVVAWLHQVRDGQFTFLQIVHDLGKITLTPEHLIFVGINRYPQHASTIRPGDKLFVFKNYGGHQTISMAIVLSIHKVEGEGIYAPLTSSGCLLVDNVDVSCYCTINPLKVMGKEIISSHALAHAGFLPLRLAFKFGLNINNPQLIDESGIHGYARLLMHVILGK